METLGAEVAIALDNVRLYDQVDTLFRRYLSPDVAETLRRDPSRSELGGSVVELTALFADLRGFTSFSESSMPEDIVATLNTYFGRAVPIVLRNGGTIVQFMGDALLAVSTPRSLVEITLFARLTAGLALQGAISAEAAAHSEWPRFRIGINTGSALVGNIGSDQFRSFNVIGDAVNVASRLQSIAEPGTVVISSHTRESIGEAGQGHRPRVTRSEGVWRARSRPTDSTRLVAISSNP